MDARCNDRKPVDVALPYHFEQGLMANVLSDRRRAPQPASRSNPVTLVTPAIRYRDARLAHDQQRAIGSEGVALQPEGPGARPNSEVTTIMTQLHGNDRNGGQPAMHTPPIVSPQAGEAARQQLLVKKKAQMRAHDARADGSSAAIGPNTAEMRLTGA
jgi:hypothetical protein